MRHMNAVHVVTSYSVRCILILSLYLGRSLFNGTSAANILCSKMGVFLNQAIGRDLLYCASDCV